MVINTEKDVFDLLDSRFEAMEDLNCDELYSCVTRFMILLNSVYNMRLMSAMARCDPDDKEFNHKAKEIFVELRDSAVEAAERIDELTLRDDAAE